MKKLMKHAGEMTHEEQIRRLVKQRNDLWKFIDEHVIYTSHNFKHASKGDDGVLSDDDIEGTVEIHGYDYVMIRSELWDELVAYHSAKRRDELGDESDALVDNTYVIEGHNPHTGDDNPDVPEEVRKLYDVGTEEWL